MKRILTIAILTLSIAASTSFAESCATEAGRFTLGGSFSFPFEYNKFRKAIFGYSLKPQGSYFVMDGLEIAAGLTFANVLETGFSQSPRMEEPGTLKWGVMVGVHYFFQTGTVFQPYLGFDIGTLMVDWQYKQLIWYLQAPIGVAWFINRNVAIDFAIPVSVDFSSTALFEKLTVNPGYLGIRAYF